MLVTDKFKILGFPEEQPPNSWSAFFGILTRAMCDETFSNAKTSCDLVQAKIIYLHF